MQAERKKDVVVIGGPNGAGKTTWAYRRLDPTVKIREFVNADEIARGISPLDPEASAIAAGRLMLDRLNELVSAGHSFAFETTCSGRGHVRLLKQCRTVGYQITLIFLWLPSADVALSRVARRISRGGHRIPDEVVVRRYSAGLRNMCHLYVPLADRALIYDNSDNSTVLIASRRLNEQFVVHDRARWALIEEASQ
jgi:predicted ABC-type ATPase